MADVMLRCGVPPHIGQSWGAIASEANPASAINSRWRFLDMRDDSGDNWQARPVLRPNHTPRQARGLSYDTASMACSTHVVTHKPQRVHRLWSIS